MPTALPHPLRSRLPAPWWLFPTHRAAAGSPGLGRMLRLTVLFVLLLTAAWPALAATKRALLIGMDGYHYVPPLKNARADAHSMQHTLQAAGYAVTLYEDLGQNALKDALRVFKNQVQGGDHVVVYFSGHGVQVGRQLPAARGRSRPGGGSGQG